MSRKHFMTALLCAAQVFGQNAARSHSICVFRGEPAQFCGKEGT